MTRNVLLARVAISAALVVGIWTLLPQVRDVPKPARAADAPVIPHGQSKPPGPALSPEEAIARMTVPEGFEVELVAAEPDIVNPVAMTFDERGRIWITESLEYPRLSAGPGRDRVKVLEDTTGDGRADRITIFADDLNIPSGIAVGAGGVWVANAPDILFLQDTDGDGRADKREVVVTGFGRDDVHELPNSLTWGPDGYLYGLNGVFNHSRVESAGRVHEFTAAMFRIDPRTRRFELFAEGTSNPWGIAFNGNGSALVSACVIDHLWHLVETGYYHRQAGAYPPFAWKIESIVDHRHQQAAYCGLHYFDSDAYPEPYRGKLYMGNIHGNCINSDSLATNGATYAGRAEPDFLSANDAWFMPVAQKTGPDGCLYVLDWYDRYHCYQDARRDPEGIDRGRGRLYRVRYRGTPRAAPFNMAEESNDRLIERLNDANVYFRDTAQRLLAERALPETRSRLEQIVLDAARPEKLRRHALWALVGGGPLEPAFHRRLLDDADPVLRAWGVRAAGNMREVDASVRDAVTAAARSDAPKVRLQVAIACAKLAGVQPTEVLVDVLAHSPGDRLIPHIVWQNLHPRLEREAERFVAAIGSRDVRLAPAVALVIPRAVDRLLAVRPVDTPAIAHLLRLVADDAATDRQLPRQCLAIVAGKVQSGEIAGDDRARLRDACATLWTSILEGSGDAPLYLDAALLAVSFGEDAGRAAVHRLLADDSQTETLREQALHALAATGDPQLLDVLRPLLNDADAPEGLKRRVLGALARLDQPQVAPLVLDNYAALPTGLRAQALELLTSRAAWSGELLAAIADNRLDAGALHANQVRKLLTMPDEQVRRRAEAIWGAVRDQRDPKREEVIDRVRRLVRTAPGDPLAGRAAFRKACANCHKIYGEGHEVGPDLTANGRNSFEQLLSNVLDPSLVIGTAYQARTVVTTDGRIITGLVVEEGPLRVVLKQQGDKIDTIPRDQIDQMETSKLSLMPEDVDKQLTERELADLFAFLVLDRPPEDSAARRLPGVDAPLPRETADPAEFAELVRDVAPGFALRASGNGGVAIMAEHRGRAGVLRTHPVRRDRPAVLTARVDVARDRTTTLRIEASHHAEGDWRLVVRGGGKTLLASDVNPQTAPDGWLEAIVDLTPLAGETVDLEIANEATGWENEHAYFSRVDVTSE